jgi:hypothetical protein
MGNQGIIKEAVGSSINKDILAEIHKRILAAGQARKDMKELVISFLKEPTYFPYMSDLYRFDKVSEMVKKIEDNILLLERGIAAAKQQAEITLDAELAKNLVKDFTLFIQLGTKLIQQYQENLCSMEN